MVSGLGSGGRFVSRREERRPHPLRGCLRLAGPAYARGGKKERMGSSPRVKREGAGPKREEMGLQEGKGRDSAAGLRRLSGPDREEE